MMCKRIVEFYYSIKKDRASIVTYVEEGGERAMLVTAFNSSELNPDYMTTDRLFEALGKTYRSHHVDTFSCDFDNLLISFVEDLRNFKGGVVNRSISVC